MKRIVLLVCLAAALRMAGLLPFSGSDVADLVPVEALTVDWRGNQVGRNGGECQGYGTDGGSGLGDVQAEAGCDAK